MMAFMLATEFDFIAYMSKMAFFLEAFFTPMAFLEYDMASISHLTGLSATSVQILGFHFTSDRIATPVQIWVLIMPENL